MKIRIVSIGLLSAWAIACSIQDPEIPIPDSSAVFYASFEKAAKPDTRVYATEDLYLRWNADDRVSIFDRDTRNKQYRFTGNTGDNAGGFELVDAGSSTSGDPLDVVYSIYPFSGTTWVDGTGRIAVTLPAEQPYAVNTFGLGANTMVAATNDNLLMYKSVGGFLLLKLYGDDVSVSSISLKGNQGERIAGDATVTMQVDGVPEASVSETSGQEITLVCDTPVQIGSTAESATAFWIVVPPTTFSGGFTVQVKDLQKGIFKRSTTSRFEITRNKLAKMSALKVVPEPTETFSLTLDQTSVTMKVGESTTLHATVTPSGAPLTWTSSDNGIVTVYSGVITALKAGEATISVRSGEKTAQCSVKVSDSSTGIGDWEVGDNDNGSI